MLKRGHDFWGEMFRDFFFSSGREDRERYDLVMFDVDSKDPSVGISCPPKPFVSDEILVQIRNQCLRPGGKRIERKLSKIVPHSSEASIFSLSTQVFLS